MAKTRGFPVPELIKIYAARELPFDFVVYNRGTHDLCQLVAVGGTVSLAKGWLSETRISSSILGHQKWHP